jgi:hypothetical protein
MFPVGKGIGRGRQDWMTTGVPYGFRVRSVMRFIGRGKYPPILKDSALEADKAASGVVPE